jgi:hypothetical protein
VLVGVDYARRRMVLSAQGFAEKALSRCCVAFSREKEVDRRTAGVVAFGALAKEAATGKDAAVQVQTSSSVNIKA